MLNKCRKNNRQKYRYCTRQRTCLEHSRKKWRSYLWSGHCNHLWFVSQHWKKCKYFPNDRRLQEDDLLHILRVEKVKSNNGATSGGQLVAAGDVNKVLASAASAVGARASSAQDTSRGQSGWWCHRSSVFNRLPSSWSEGRLSCAKVCCQSRQKRCCDLVNLNTSHDNRHTESYKLDKSCWQRGKGGAKGTRYLKRQKPDVQGFSR